MNTSVLARYVEKTAAGGMTFPEVVGVCVSEGVERYAVDLERLEITHYPESGESHRMALPLAPGESPARDFLAEEVRQAVKAAQADAVRYPEFVRRVLAAGCTGYTVYVRGRQVRYDGRDGGSHTEFFPGRP